MTSKLSERKIEYVAVERESVQYATEISTEASINHIS